MKNRWRHYWCFLSDKAISNIWMNCQQLLNFHVGVASAKPKAMSNVLVYDSQRRGQFTRTFFAVAKKSVCAAAKFTAINGIKNIFRQSTHNP